MWEWGGETRERSWGAGSVLFLGGCSFCVESVSCLISFPNNISKNPSLALRSHRLPCLPTVKNNLLSVQCMSLLS